MREKDIEQVIRTINQALHALDLALTSSELPQKGPMSKEQLRIIHQELGLMLDDLSARRFREATKRGGRFSRIIIDSWPIDSPLGDLLLKAENEFIKICNQLEAHDTRNVPR